MAEFKIGDLVTLKTGGPSMIVTEVKKGVYDGVEKVRVSCEWMDGNAHFDDEFFATSLKRTVT